MSTYAQRVQLGPFFSGGTIQGGAKVYHYLVGTSTDKDIWSDRGKTTPLAQPFVSDSQGIFNFFADGLYKLVIVGPNSSGPGVDVLYTLDNWQFLDTTEQTLSKEGVAIPSASTIAVGPEVWAHITGSTNIDTITGTVPFFWAVFDGNLRLNHSSTLLLPEQSNRSVRTGEVAFFLNEGAGVWRLAGYWMPGKQTDIASASTIAAPTHGSMVDITGVADIDTITTTHAGHEFTARFTNAAGLNLNHSATLVCPWGVDYRTVENEVIRFIQVSATAWAACSLNGPKERVGQVVTFDSIWPPPGFLARNGGEINRATYSGLFQEIGTTYGAGDGMTSFNLPDGRGRVNLQIDGGTGRVTSASTGGANANTLGGAGGAQTHTLTTSEGPPGYSGVGGVVAHSASTNWSTQIVGGSAHSNTQPWIATNKYIRW
jgi:microcystin-dependent protein